MTLDAEITVLPDAAIAPRPISASDDNPIAAAVARAREAGRYWRALDLRQRGRILKALRQRMVARRDELAEAVRRDIGKPTLDVFGEIAHCCQVIGYCRRESARLLRPRRVHPRLLIHKRAEIHYEPLGVVGIISPANYPIILSLAPAVQALICGNAVIVKPSERTPATAAVLARLFDELKLPAPVCQWVDGAQREALALAASGVDKLVFIGGRQGALAVAAEAARRLTPAVFELGGNDPMIVAEDADLERAAHAAVWGAFFNAGQSCIAVERCYVARPVVGAFLERVRQRVAALELGTPSVEASGEYDVGRVYAEEQVPRLQSLVDDALARGATIAAQRSAPEDARLFPPTVLANVNHSMRVMREEVFGPLLPVMAVDSLDEAVALANESELGLAASVWSTNRARAREIAERLHVGGVVINDCLIHFAIPELPFGGVKGSGWGRLGGREGLLEFCVPKTITRHWFGPRRELFWFPVAGKARWLGKLLRLVYG